MVQALILLTMALKLLTLASGPNIPESLKQSAISTAKYAIQIAQNALKEPATVSAPEKVVESPKESASQLAKDFKLSYQMGTSSMTFFADGFRDKQSIRGWFKWWAVNKVNHQTLSSQALSSVRLPEKENDVISPIRFDSEISFKELLPNSICGYSLHFFQFYFEKGNMYNSSSDPVMFEIKSCSVQ